jgi:hypothetical protein
MSEEVKFTDEELVTVKEIQETYYNIQSELGQLSIARLRLEKQLSNLDGDEDNINKSFFGNQEKEIKFLEGITAKYGQGSLNPETGVFTPNKSEKTK